LDDRENILFPKGRRSGQRNASTNLASPEKTALKAQMQRGVQKKRKRRRPGQNLLLWN
jgi:hypothetical protein